MIISELGPMLTIIEPALTSVTRAKFTMQLEPVSAPLLLPPSKVPPAS